MVFDYMWHYERHRQHFTLCAALQMHLADSICKLRSLISWETQSVMGHIFCLIFNAFRLDRVKSFLQKSLSCFRKVREECIYRGPHLKLVPLGCVFFLCLIWKRASCVKIWREIVIVGHCGKLDINTPIKNDSNMNVISSHANRFLDQEFANKIQLTPSDSINGENY